jgi:adenosine/AMP kinase
MKLDLEVVKVEKPQDINIIIGQSHFIKTVEDIYEALVASVPSIKFGLAFCESSAKRLIRTDGTDEECKKIAIDNAKRIGCGHMFFIALKDTFPINVLNQVKNVSEVCRVFCATANPAQVIVAVTQQGRGILGVIDGEIPAGVETEEDINERKQLLRKFGYKR